VRELGGFLGTTKSIAETAKNSLKIHFFTTWVNFFLYTIFFFYGQSFAGAKMKLREAAKNLREWPKKL
jgi:hypothetical protein